MDTTSPEESPRTTEAAITSHNSLNHPLVPFTNPAGEVRGAALGRGAGVARGLGVGVTLGVGVAVGVGVGVPERQLPLTFITMCILGKPRSSVVVGVGTPQSAALR
jgi:hypothetical protein